jgi:anti-sigma factor RsiW
MTTNPSRTPAALDRLLVDAEPYVSCEECFERLDRYVEQRLAGGPAESDLEAHLRACPACAEDVASLTALLEADATARPPLSG